MTELNLEHNNPNENGQYSLTVKVTDVKTSQDLPQYTVNVTATQAGKDFEYNQEKVFDELRTQGYKILNSTVAIPDKIMESDQVVNIFVDHDIKEINPTQAGNGLKNVDLQKNVTRIIIYQGANGNNPATVTDTLHFVGKSYFDQVTKKWTNAIGDELEDQTQNIDWSHEDGTTFRSVNTPFIEGYHVESIVSPDGKKYDDGKGNIAEMTDVEQTLGNIMITVTYAPNGQLILVDKDGQQLPASESYSFPTDPEDITKITAIALPSIEGYHPANGKVGDLIQPKEDPSQDTMVIYLSGSGTEQAVYTTPKNDSSEKGFLTVVFHDDIIDEDINVKEGVGYTSGQQIIGTQIEYDPAVDVEKLRKLGYEVAKSQVEIPTKIQKGYNVFTIHVKHHILHLAGKPGEEDPEYPSITPHDERMALHKDIKRIIRFINDRGQSVNGAPDGTSEVVQEVHFYRTAIVDQVTGKVLGFEINGNKQISSENSESAWQCEEDTNIFPKVVAKYPGDIGYFQITQKAVEPQDNVLPSDKDVTIKIVYSQRINKGVSDTYSAMQTIKFVGEKDNQLREPIIETKTGLIGDHTFKRIKVPVIAGYVAEKAEAGGLIVSEEKTNVMQKVVYHKVGKILPVNPMGKPIPNVDRPNYINDPDDATKVLTDQDTPILDQWSTNIPSISPENPTLDTKVPYMNASGGIGMEDIETKRAQDKTKRIEKEAAKEFKEAETDDQDDNDLFGLAVAILGLANSDEEDNPENNREDKDNT